MKQDNTKTAPKFIGFLIALILLVIAVPVFQLVLGFTNPTANPPNEGGKLAASGDDLSISNVKLVDVASPVADNDAANKAYVDGQVGGGGLVTLFGVRGSFPGAGSVLRPGGSIATCLRWYNNGSGSCTNSYTAPTPAGFASATICQDTLGAGSTKLMDGYGPFNEIYMTGGYGLNPDGSPNPANGEEENTEEGSAYGSSMVSINDSICSLSPYHVVRINSAQPGNIQVAGSDTVVAACAQGGNATCNVCTVCTAP
ncbi:MAG: hypothetical protein Q8Q32_02190 [bacterium]|nr:hypothetical protein [bacterium]